MVVSGRGYRRYSLFEITDHACPCFRYRLQGSHEPAVCRRVILLDNMVKQRSAEEPRAPVGPPETSQRASGVAQEPARRRFFNFRNASGNFQPKDRQEDRVTQVIAGMPVYAADAGTLYADGRGMLLNFRADCLDQFHRLSSGLSREGKGSYMRRDEMPYPYCGHLHICDKKLRTQYERVCLYLGAHGGLFPMAAHYPRQMGKLRDFFQ